MAEQEDTIRNTFTCGTVLTEKQTKQTVLTHTQRNNNNCHRFADDFLYKQSCKKDLYVTSNQVGKKKKKTESEWDQCTWEKYGEKSPWGGSSL